MKAKMMKKCVGLVALAMVLNSAYAITTSEKIITTNAANGDTGVAEYVSLENAPVIDGVYDDVWTTAIPVRTDEKVSGAFGTVSILWNETGLYFFAKVEDDSLNLSDLCNLWVSETYYESGKDYYPEVNGAYYLCLNPEGENQYYHPGSLSADKYVDMRDKYQVATNIQDNVYFIEVYVPLMGDADLVLYNSIGFNVSVDDYLTEGSSRDSYAYWSAQWNGEYWQYPAACAEVLLVDYHPEDNNQGGENSGNSSSDGTADSSDVESSTSSEAGEGQSSSDQGLTGCFSNISVLSCGVIACLASIILKKKKE